MNKFWFRRAEKIIPDDVAGWKWYKLTKGTRFSIEPNIKYADDRANALFNAGEFDYMMNYKIINPLLTIPIDLLSHIDEHAVTSSWGFKLSDVFIDE